MSAPGSPGCNVGRPSAGRASASRRRRRPSPSAPLCGRRAFELSTRVEPILAIPTTTTTIRATPQRRASSSSPRRRCPTAAPGGGGVASRGGGYMGAIHHHETWSPRSSTTSRRRRRRFLGGGGGRLVVGRQLVGRILGLGGLGRGLGVVRELLEDEVVVGIDAHAGSDIHGLAGNGGGVETVDVLEGAGGGEGEGAAAADAADAVRGFEDVAVAGEFVGNIGVGDEQDGFETSQVLVGPPGLGEVDAGPG
mmetsp:Transcript_3564/g.9159  ORF Transcript_3564/g.9159 Transcript_3564/m.9159 type:complete len:251 (+) Transcript_3564:653-1405(+)